VTITAAISDNHSAGQSLSRGPTPGSSPPQTSPAVAAGPAAAAAAAPGTPSYHQVRSSTAGLRTPGGTSSAAPPGSSSSTRVAVQLLLRELRQVPLLPVFGKPGVLVAARGGATMTTTTAHRDCCAAPADEGAVRVDTLPAAHRRSGEVPAQVISGSIGGEAPLFFPLRGLLSEGGCVTSDSSRPAGPAGLPAGPPSRCDEDEALWPTGVSGESLWCTGQQLAAAGSCGSLVMH
jgi:hypothetical protein